MFVVVSTIPGSEVEVVGQEAAVRETSKAHGQYEEDNRQVALRTVHKPCPHHQTTQADEGW